MIARGHLANLDESAGYNIPGIYSNCIQLLMKLRKYFLVQVDGLVKKTFQ